MNLRAKWKEIFQDKFRSEMTPGQKIAEKVVMVCISVSLVIFAYAFLWAKDMVGHLGGLAIAGVLLWVSYGVMKKFNLIK